MERANLFNWLVLRPFLHLVHIVSSRRAGHLSTQQQTSVPFPTRTKRPHSPLTSNEKRKAQNYPSLPYRDLLTRPSVLGIPRISPAGTMPLSMVKAGAAKRPPASYSTLAGHAR